jgi:hypothetical protein
MAVPKASGIWIWRNEYAAASTERWTWGCGPRRRSSQLLPGSYLTIVWWAPFLPEILLILQYRGFLESGDVKFGARQEGPREAKGIGKSAGRCKNDVHIYVCVFISSARIWIFFEYDFWSLLCYKLTENILYTIKKWSYFSYTTTFFGLFLIYHNCGI